MATDQIKFERLPGHFTNSHNGKNHHVDVTKVSMAITGSGGFRPDQFVAFVYRCHLNEDNDGAPNCYGWDNPTNLFPGQAHVQKNLDPLDHLANATSPATDAHHHQNLFHNHNFKWSSLYARTKDEADGNNPPLVIDQRSVLRDRHHRFPVVQPPDGAAPGYYVSTTSVAADDNFDEWEPERYWDASQIPFGVLAPEWADHAGVNLGDFGLAIRNNTGTQGAFTFLDSGPHNHVGEVSRKLARTLVPTPDHKAVPNEDFVSFLVFPGSGVKQQSQLEKLGDAVAQRDPSARLKAEVAKQIAKLAKADNADELALFLALGANLHQFKMWIRNFYSDKEYGKDKTHIIPPVFLSIMMALSAFGYPTDGKFHGVSKSVNL